MRASPGWVPTPAAAWDRTLWTEKHGDPWAQRQLPPRAHNRNPETLTSGAEHKRRSVGSSWSR